MALLNKIPRESQENMGYIQEGGVHIESPKPFILNGKGCKACESRRKEDGMQSECSYCFSIIVDPLTLPANHAGSVTSKPELASDGPGKAAEAVIAEWVFKNKGEGGIHPATGGINKASSILQQVGGYFEYYDSKAQDISYQGWDNGQGKKYWLATVPTSAYKNIKLSSEQSSSGSAPNDFKVQVSTDRTVWTDVPGGTVQMNIVSSYNCPNQSCIPATSLPNADDKQMLYIRWVVNSNKPTNPKDNPNGIGSGGSSKIRNIRVTGEPISELRLNSLPSTYPMCRNKVAKR